MEHDDIRPGTVFHRYIVMCGVEYETDAAADSSFETLEEAKRELDKWCEYRTSFGWVLDCDGRACVYAKGLRDAT